MKEVDGIIIEYIDIIGANGQKIRQTVKRLPDGTVENIFEEIDDAGRVKPIKICGLCLAQNTKVFGSNQTIAELSNANSQVQTLEKDGSVSVRKVLGKYSRKVSDYVKVFVGGEELKSSTDHEFKTNKGWFSAGSLRKGMMLFSLALNSFVPVDSMAFINEPLQVEGLALGNVEGYGVGSLGILVAPSDACVLGFSNDSYITGRQILGNEADDFFKGAREIGFDDLSPNEAEDMANAWKTAFDDMNPDDLLNLTAKQLQDAKAFQTQVSRIIEKQAEKLGKKYGSEITFDVTYNYIDNNGILQVGSKRIRADHVVQELDGSYQLFDSKTSIKPGLADKSSLLSSCQENQRIVYPLIDDIGTPSNKIIKIEMVGDNAKNRFGQTSLGTVNIKKSVIFYVNKDPLDFRQFITRPLIK